MNLKDFIQETLSQIAEGISEADAAVSKLDAAVNPRDVVTNKNGEGPYGYYADDRRGNYRRGVESVEFDVVISVDKGTETKGGIGIHVGAVSLGSAGKSELSNSSESRIKFRVPMLFPSSKIEPKPELTDLETSSVQSRS